jgi:hypothetical protein
MKLHGSKGKFDNKSDGTDVLSAKKKTPHSVSLQEKAHPDYPLFSTRSSAEKRSMRYGRTVEEGEFSERSTLL